MLDGKIFKPCSKVLKSVAAQGRRLCPQEMCGESGDIWDCCDLRGQAGHWCLVGQRLELLSSIF